MENAPSRLYKMPQYVKVALKIYKRSSTVPRNVIELYGRIFGDALQDAQQRMLEERAFESVSQRKQFYLESSVPNDSELIKQLNQTGFLMADKSTYQFSHHSIVIYLSAKHFAREWKQLLSKPDLIVDRNWADVLEMTCDLFTQHSDILDMLSLLSEKHRDIALQLLSRFTAAHPGLGEKALLPFWEHFSKSFFRLSRA